MSFKNPEFLLLLLLLLPLWGSYLRGKRRPAFRFPNGDVLKKVRAQSRGFHQMQHLFLVFRTATLFFLAVALARPLLGRSEVIRKTQGLDIVLAIDASKSMEALDFELNGDTSNRMGAVKHVIRQFIDKRPEDRIGMVVFGTEAFTQSPLTLDHDIVLGFLDKVRIGIAGRATAIGDAIATATKRLTDIEAKSKIVILLTDGRNTAGSIEPLIAAEAAAALGIKIYTIGVGKDGKVPFPQQGFWGNTRIVYQESDLDEESLKTIAEATDAKYFRAYDTKSLEEIYDTIDKLEKTKLEIKEYHNYEEAFAFFLWPGLFFLLAELGLGMTRFRSVP